MIGSSIFSHQLLANKLDHQSSPSYSQTNLLANGSSFDMSGGRFDMSGVRERKDAGSPEPWNTPMEGVVGG